MEEIVLPLNPNQSISPMGPEPEQEPSKHEIDL